MSLQILSALLLFSPALASPNLFPAIVPQLKDRATYNGGWSLGLSNESCPADAPVSCLNPDINPTCCPFGQICFGDFQPYCCPTDVDCSSVVTNLPVCANSTWNMFLLDSTYYVCCEPGQVALNPTTGLAGICEPVDQPVVSSQLATLASQIGGPPITTGPGGGAATATTTPAGHGKTTATGAASTSTHTSGFSSSGSSASAIYKKIHLTLGELVGILVGGVVLVAAIVAGIWACCCRRRSNPRTQVTYVEPYRNQGVPYTAAEGYSGAYSPYAGARGVEGEGDAMPLRNYGQEYKPNVQPVQSELGI